MWSLGCVIAELFLGWPLYPGALEYDQVNNRLLTAHFLATLGSSYWVEFPLLNPPCAQCNSSQHLLVLLSSSMTQSLLSSPSPCGNSSFLSILQWAFSPLIGFTLSTGSSLIGHTTAISLPPILTLPMLLSRQHYTLCFHPVTYFPGLFSPSSLSFSLFSHLPLFFPIKAAHRGEGSVCLFLSLHAIRFSITGLPSGY